MKFNIRKIEKEKLQKFMLNTAMFAMLTANMTGTNLPMPSISSQVIDSIKMDAFGKFAPDTALANTTAVASPISVYVNGSAISFTDASPFIENGRTMVPLRGVFETMGYEVQWDSETWSDTAENLTRLYGTPNPTLITIRSGSNIITNPIYISKDNVITQNGAVVESDAAPKMVSGRYYLPLRAIAEATGAEVSWNNDSRRVDINFSSVSMSDSGSGTITAGGTYEGMLGAVDLAKYQWSSDAEANVVLNMSNWNHKVFYAGAPAGNAHGLPEGAYYIDSDAVVNGSVADAYQYPVEMGHMTIPSIGNQTIYIGESRASIEAKIGIDQSEVREQKPLYGDQVYFHYGDLGISIEYTASGRACSIMMYNNSTIDKNLGVSYGTSRVVLGSDVFYAGTDEAKAILAPNEGGGGARVRATSINFEIDANGAATKLYYQIGSSTLADGSTTWTSVIVSANKQVNYKDVDPF